MPIIFYRGKILFRDGKIATSLDCCCNQPCYKYCFYVQGSVSGFPNEPGVSPPLTHPFSSRDARIVYHGHYQDDDPPGPLGSLYHTHLWMIEFCITPTSNKDPGLIAIEYYISLEQWVNDVLYPTWTGQPPGPGGGGDSAGEMSCSLSALQEKKDQFFDSPADYHSIQDLLGPLAFDGCDECDGTLPDSSPS